MKVPKKAVKKAVKVSVLNDVTRVWCEHCDIRIAPNEDRTVIGDKTYHPRCSSRLNPAQST